MAFHGSEKHVQAQGEFEHLRAQLPHFPTKLASAKLRVLSETFMAKRGGAAAIYGWTCISERMLQAPDEVRRAVIAHECGHIAAGHCLVSKLALAVALIYGIRTFGEPSTGMNIAINIALLVLVTGLTAWSLRDKREYEADALAAAVVGPAAMAQAIRWVIENYRQGVYDDTIKERLRRLDASAAEANAREHS